MGWIFTSCSCGSCCHFKLDYLLFYILLFMSRKFYCMSAVLLTVAACVTSCKDDSEDDWHTGPSEVAGLYINEVCSSGTDWVELYNSSDAEISLSGFRLQDNKGADEEYVFPMEAKIAANGFLVLEKDTHFGFGISGSGDEIKLLDASYKQIDDIMVPPLEDGQTYVGWYEGKGQYFHARRRRGRTTWRKCREPLD